jgi:hypothetical protein
MASAPQTSGKSSSRYVGEYRATKRRAGAPTVVRIPRPAPGARFLFGEAEGATDAYDGVRDDVTS